jgi:hypothetical protein
VFDDGVTEIWEPSALGVPDAACVQAASVNHFHDAPVPRVPPVGVRVIALPAHAVAAEAVIEVGALDGVLTAIA